jgi:hypothetical protein
MYLHQSGKNHVGKKEISKRLISSLCVQVTHAPLPHTVIAIAELNDLHKYHGIHCVELAALREFLCQGVTKASTGSPGRGFSPQYLLVFVTDRQVRKHIMYSMRCKVFREAMLFFSSNTL